MAYPVYFQIRSETQTYPDVLDDISTLTHHFGGDAKFVEAPLTMGLPIAKDEVVVGSGLMRHGGPTFAEGLKEWILESKRAYEEYVDEAMEGAMEDFIDWSLS